MVFTNSQRVSIRTLLGYPSRFLDYGIEAAIDLAERDSDVEIKITNILNKFDQLDGYIFSSYSTAGIKSAGKNEIEFFEGGSKCIELQNSGRRLISQLSIILGVFPVIDYYNGLLLNNCSGIL
jgi:hypothetical protein